MLGISFEELGIGIARSWGFPEHDRQRHAQPAGVVRARTTTEERMRILASYSNELLKKIYEANFNERCTKILSTKLQQLGDNELRAYYNDNLNEFSPASAFDVTVAAAINNTSSYRSGIIEFFNGVELKETYFEAGKTDPKLTLLLHPLKQPKVLFRPWLSLIKTSFSFL